MPDIPDFGKVGFRRDSDFSQRLVMAPQVQETFWANLRLQMRVLSLCFLFGWLLDSGKWRQKLEELYRAPDTHMTMNVSSEVVQSRPFPG